MDDTRPPTDEAVETGAALRLVVGRIARRVRQAHAVGDLTHSEISVLARLDRDGADSPARSPSWNGSARRPWRPPWPGWRSAAWCCGAPTPVTDAVRC